MRVVNLTIVFLCSRSLYCKASTNLATIKRSFRLNVVYRSCIFWIVALKTRNQVRKPFTCFEIRSQTKILSISCSLNSIGTSTTKICLHVKGNSLMPVFFWFLNNATLGNKILASNMVRFRQSGKSNCTNFKRKIPMHVG